MSVCDQSFTIYCVNVHLSKMEVQRKFEFFRIFHLKKKNSSGSDFYMKNVFFWSTLCKSSSKIKNVGGGLISCNFSLIAAYEPPSQFHNFLATSTWCTSKEHIFHVEFRSRRNFFFLKWKIWKNLNFLCTSILDRCTLKQYIVILWSQIGISKWRPIFIKIFLCVAFDPTNNNL